MPTSRTAAWIAYIDEFTWQPGKLPLSTPIEAAGMVAAYLVLIFGLQAYLSGKPKLSAAGEKQLARLMGWHNLALSGTSLAMFVGTLWGSMTRYQRDGGSAKFLFCESREEAKWVGALPFWAYVYYLSKFWEFGDTVFKVLKRKELDFLHVYHHALVVLMCYLWLETHQSLQQMGQMANCLVHVFMYYYYYRSQFTKERPWWKPVVTNGQILQFQMSFVLCSGLLYYQYAAAPAGAKLDAMIGVNDELCMGYRAFLYNICFNLSLLYLFSAFKKKTYGADKAKKVK